MASAGGPPEPGAAPLRAPIEGRLADAGLPPLPRTAWLELDVDALRGNLEVLREAAGDGVRVEPVVKADAYGHGSVPIALALEAAGADGLSVATLDEAVELRDAGVSLPLLVLYPIPPEQVEAAAWAHIAVSLGPGRLLERTLAAASHAAGTGAPELAVHLEIETGLGRGGVLPADVAAAVRQIDAEHAVRLAGAWTHLAAADDDVSAGAQDRRFAGALDALGAAVVDAASVRLHLAGSGGLLGDAVGRYDAVRTGIATYGLVPDGLVPPPAMTGAAARLRPVLALYARPVRVATMPAGHGVSYGPAFVTDRPSSIATLPLGYGDGWRRTWSGQTHALVRGIRVPVVGRVAMDGIMADVTDVPGPPVTEDDEFVLIGAQGDEAITALDLAATGGTISYEVVTGMSRRLPRVYHAAGSPVGVRYLAGGRSEWRASSSGTGTSATSRSTPS
ncbi:MAG TPA: alanine racemase [Candidatus Limnocylindrales bacterium]|nr:alanine racemase [Candidatus Limnocylindrales bacterium]